MPNPALETIEPPYTAFRFEVVLNLDSALPGITNPICNAAFAECDGLEMSMEPKILREGGNNQESITLMGPVSYGQLTLRRGMTANIQLWTWFAAATQTGQRATAQGVVTQWDAAGRPRLSFVLTNCLPVRLRGPSLNAKDGQVAIEEMQIVYSRLSVRLAGEAGSGQNMASSTVSGGPGLSNSTSSSRNII
ncbi:phage tail protein [Dictyobacter formicarum]|uniref:Phage tail protein n=1 Tax=Dictyobacter formicarum TaxID=2778368 RepID=A0ABQ3VP88_9CHLR|nr:phage tail protein [Dictyobacter formicarum]GHO87628.1 hypothetical protein KSZ_56340 [Dictyobacter formicarum]